MARDVIPDYFPEKCYGCETLGAAITARHEAVDGMGLLPSMAQINRAHRLGTIARTLCERAEIECPGINAGCMFEDNNDKEL